jgi:hypothetical protein
MMKRRIKSAWMTTAFAVIGAALSIGSAEAGSIVSSSKGITVGGGVVFNPDPQYTYYLNISIDDDTLPTYNSISPSASLTIDGLKGLASGDFYNESYSSLANPPVDPALTIGTNSVTLNLYNYGAPITVSGSQLVYQFIIQTDNNQSPPPPTTFNYSYSIGGSSPTFVGPVTFTQGPLGVPEPGSLILLLMGGTAVTSIAIRERRRRGMPRGA